MTYGEDFRIDKWGGPNRGTGGTHWDLWHLPTGRKMGSFSRRRDAIEMRESLLPLAADMKQLANMRHGPERQALMDQINHAWANR